MKLFGITIETPNWRYWLNTCVWIGHRREWYEGERVLIPLSALRPRKIGLSLSLSRCVRCGAGHEESFEPGLVWYIKMRVYTVWQNIVYFKPYIGTSEPGHFDPNDIPF